MTSIEKKLTSFDYLGLFLLSAAVLMLELLLVRVISVTMWYHYAFVAISIALFGLCVGSIVVFIFPVFFSEERFNDRLYQASLAFSISIILAYFAHLTIPVPVGITDTLSFVGFYSLSLNFMVLAIPFFFSGIVVSLMFARRGKRVSILYASNMIGSAFGCILLIVGLQGRDAHTMIFAVSALAALGALFYRKSAGKKSVATVVYLAVLVVFFIVNTALVRAQHPIIRFLWVKGDKTTPIIYQAWNSYSLVEVFGDSLHPTIPISWGYSPKLYGALQFVHLYLKIDGAALTPLTQFRGDLQTVEYLKHSITNIAHEIRHDADVFIIGPGGGRDILAALLYRQRSIIGVELNDAIRDATVERFGTFTGHFDRYPQVKYYVGEARTYLTRHEDKYDIIQASFIDTWAATAAGAYALSENSLYTTEAWDLFFNRLNPGGVLTFSRWWEYDHAGEIYRLVALARQALERRNIDDFLQHIVILRAPFSKVTGIGTILVSPTPFSREDCDTIERVAADNEFEVMFSPDRSRDSMISQLLRSQHVDEIIHSYSLNLTPPTDDRPFFFNMVRLRDFLHFSIMGRSVTSFNNVAITSLMIMVVISLVFSVLFILLPIRQVFGGWRKIGFAGNFRTEVNLKAGRNFGIERNYYLIFYFICLGLGYLLIEVALMQRLNLFLGHPVYGVAVVLPVLLASSGFGGLLTHRFSTLDLQNNPPGTTSVQKKDCHPRFIWMTLIVFLILCGVFLAPVLHLIQATADLTKILVVIACLTPLGLLMGTPFPLGIQSVTTPQISLIPWLWGLNGAASIFASVFAVVLSISAGISATFWIGFICYAVGASLYILTISR